MRVAAPQNVVPNNRKFDTFSRNHREQLALGAAAKGERKGHKSKARITVTVRKRPLTPQESSNKESDILIVPNRKVIKVEEPRTKITGQGYTETHEFRFDRVYSEKCTNQEVYDSCVKTLVDAIFEDGCRCSCFAFGQTGSGKTYTMVGPKKVGRLQKEVPPEHRGLWEWAAQDLVEWVRKPGWRNYGLYCSFFEIYCNRVYDLLDSRKQVRALESRTADGVVVKDLTISRVEDESTMLGLMDRGLQARITGKNSRNNDSSRGHAIFTVEVKHLEQQTNHGKLAFIDLAGSERGADSMQSGRATQQDGAGINRSLLALKECIRALDQGSSHVPFRDSELTKVIRDMFLTESALTLMIANVSPTDTSCEQTLNTLRYADRVFQMRQNCRPCINEASLDEDEEIPSGEAGTGGEEQPAEWSAAEMSDNEMTDVRMIREPHLGSEIQQDPSEEASVTESESDYTDPRTQDHDRKSSDFRAQAASKGHRGYPGSRITAAASRTGALNLVGTAREEVGRQDSNEERSVTTRKYQSNRALPTGGQGVLSRSSITRPTSPRGQPPTSRVGRYDGHDGAPVSGESLPASGRGIPKDPKKPARVLKAHAPSDFRKLKTSNAFVQPQPPRAEPPPLRSSRPPHERRSRIPTHMNRLGNDEMSASPPGTGGGHGAPLHLVCELQSSGSSSKQANHVPREESSDSVSAASSSLYSEHGNAAIEAPPCVDSSDNVRSKWRSESPVQANYITRAHGHKLAASAIPTVGGDLMETLQQKGHRRVQKDDETPPMYTDVTTVLNAGGYLSAPAKAEGLDRAAEAIPTDILELVRTILPPAESAASMNLTECPEDELKRRQAVSAASGWKSFVDFITEQQETLNSICSLTMYQVGLSREMDAMIGPRKTGGPSGSGSSKAVNVAPEKLRDARAVLEQHLASAIRLGQALTKAESALAVCEQYERELQKRSMQSLQFYQSVEPSRRETRKKAPHRALENAKP